MMLADAADQVTWLKDNKPLEDRLADRVRKSEPSPNHHRLEIYNCAESDSGLYTARANNGSGTSTCTAQLVVQKCKIFMFIMLVFSTSFHFVSWHFENDSCPSHQHYPMHMY